MPRYIAFLRAINVGGHTVRMEDLRAIFAALGMARVETFIASGNVIFETDSLDTPALESAIAARLRQELGYEVATFLRTDAEVVAAAAHLPFAAESMACAGALNVAFLASPLAPDHGETLQRFVTDLDDFHVHGREVYWRCAVKQSDSKFNNAVFERALATRATWRNLNTVRRLAAKYPPAPS